MKEQKQDWLIPLSNMTKEEALNQVADASYLVNNLMTKEEYLEAIAREK